MGRTTRNVVGRFQAFSQSARKRFTSSARSSYPRSGRAISASAQSSQTRASARANPIRWAGPIQSTSGVVSAKREKKESSAASRASTRERIRSEATSAAACAPTATRAQSAIGRKRKRSRSASRAAPRVTSANRTCRCCPTERPRATTFQVLRAAGAAATWLSAATSETPPMMLPKRDGARNPPRN